MSAVTESLARAVREQEEGLLACVHCGFCLPACPTYRRLGDEADSPRGRLHLMRAVVEGRLHAGSDAFQLHIDRCLGCRACEPVCPSGVAYGHLLELARHAGREARRPPLLSRLLLRVFGTRALAGPAMALARLLRATGIPALAARLRPGKGSPGPIRLGMAMLAATAPDRALRARRPVPASSAAPARGKPPSRLRTPHSAPAEPAAPARRSPPAAPTAHPTAAILTGCVQAGLFSRVNAATERVLRANGYEVIAVPGQGCCGALHSHGGDLDAARALARRNIRAFDAAGADFIVMNASGCGAAMSAYGSLLSGDDAMAERAATVAARVRDISELLAERGARQGREVNLKVTFDPPCHLLHAQGVSEAPEQVLRAVPGLEVLPLPGAGECCGGAGIYGLTHRELGGWIGADKVRSVVETGADAVVTANPGCMMQIGAGLRLAGHRTRVLHIVELLDESYRRAGAHDAGFGAAVPSRDGAPS